MEQFNLDIWLQDKSRKICTRDGRPVRIICWDAKVDIRQKDYHIIALIDNGSHGEDIFYFNKQGVEFFKREELFFADEEESMTEFVIRIYNLIISDPHNYPSIKEVKEEAEILLDLARKEIQPEIDEKLKEEYDRGYSIGKFDAGESKVKELV